MTDVEIFCVDSSQDKIRQDITIIIESEPLNISVKRIIDDGDLNVELAPGQYDIEIHPAKDYATEQSTIEVPDQPDTARYLFILDRAFLANVGEIDYPEDTYTNISDLDIEAENQKPIKISEVDGKYEVVAQLATKIESKFEAETFNIEGAPKYIEHVKINPHIFSIDLTLGDIYRDGILVEHRDSLLAKLRHMAEHKSLLEIESNITDVVSQLYTAESNVMITSLSVTQDESSNTYEASLELKRVEFVGLGYHYSSSVGHTDIPWGSPDSGQCIEAPTVEVDENILDPMSTEGTLRNWRNYVSNPQRYD